MNSDAPEKQAPPEVCPICNSQMVDEWPEDRDANAQRKFLCGIHWQDSGDAHQWFTECMFATKAALRTGATLHPTAREQARDALVAAAMARWDAMPDGEPVRERDWDFCLAAAEYRKLHPVTP